METPTKTPKRKYFSLSEKAKALKERDDRNLSLSEMERRSKISRKSLSVWASNSPNINAHAGSNKKRLPGGGRKPFYPVLEEYLVNYVTEQRLKKLRVSKLSIRLEASKKIKEYEISGKGDERGYDEFKLSMNWVRKFCVRHYLTYRESTHQSQQRRREPTFEFEVAKKFLLTLKEIASDFPRNLTLNMDETPAYFDMLDTQTIDFIGTKTVDLLNSGHDKNRFSLVITIASDGVLLPIGVIFKGLKKVPKCIIPANVFVYVNNSGTMDGNIMQVLL